MTIYYTYYSYENNKGIDGLGYIGYRKLKDAETPELEEYYGTPSSPKNKFYKDKKNKSKIILGVFDNKQDAVDHEIYLHALWDVKNNEHFANLANQTHDKFSYSASGPDSPRYGKTFKLSEETKQKISDSLKGELNPFYGKTHTRESKEIISQTSLGRTHTEESKNKLSLTMTGTGNPFYGKSHSKETIDKIIKKNRENFSGTKNPQYKGERINWYNQKTGVLEEQKTMIEMQTLYPELSRSNLSRLKDKKQKVHRNWIVVD